jgi:membrane protein YdbS with pleckstrin-like domain
MYPRYRSLVLHWLKVPPEPQPPFGDPASLKVFRAGRNFYRLRMGAWVFAQVLAFAGIVFWALVFLSVEETARIEKARRAAAAQAVASAPATPPAPTAPAAATPKSPADAQLKAKASPPAKRPVNRSRERLRGWDGFIAGMVEIALRLPDWAFPVLWVIKVLGLLGYLVQLPLTYAVRRLDFEMRWYVVTDRSLRIRTGVWHIQESTMSFANLQQVEVSQGPLQRVLGLADVKVQSAGGSERPHQKEGDDLHTGHFHGVDNAQEIRDLIQARLRRFRESGLGDPEESRHAHPETAATTDTVPATPVTPAGPSEVLAAARELAAEAKALRVALG